MNLDGVNRIFKILCHLLEIISSSVSHQILFATYSSLP